MKRTISADLEAWLSRERRKPLVLRGARQVGKTWAVRELASRSSLDLAEVNFEERPELGAVFEETSPDAILSALEPLLDTRVDPDRTLLFLDEIQRAPNAFANLRWFYERMPQLAVVATGSLLDFVLNDHSFSMPVGRIAYRFMEPMSFEEFLLATGRSLLQEQLLQLTHERVPPTPIHEALLQAFREYMVIGGMPEAVREWTESKSPLAVSEVQQSLLRTYADDFRKYPTRMGSDRIEKVMNSVPKQLGQKFKYSNVDRSERIEPMRNALELLTLARVCHKVHRTDARGIPLSEDARMFKVLFIDVGLAAARRGLSIVETQDIDDLVRSDLGGMTEQAVGQQLRTLPEFFMDPRLHYYSREKQGSEAELDYVIQRGTQIVPIEVKSGKAGSLKSLHQFMHERDLPLAIRVNADCASLTTVSVRLSTGAPVEYPLLSIPFYLVQQLPRLIDGV